MPKKTFAPFIGILIMAISFSANIHGAVVDTRHGIFQGRVIVREFNHVVVTILTENNRLFQFYAQDVQSVTASEETLIGEEVELKELPQEDADKITTLTPGLEIKIIESSPDEEWLQVEIWGNQQGWIPTGVLTNRVTFQESSSEASKEVQDATDVEMNQETIDSATEESNDNE